MRAHASAEARAFRLVRRFGELDGAGLDMRGSVPATYSGGMMWIVVAILKLDSVV